MRILFVTPFYAPDIGGVAGFLENIRRFLEYRGHKAFVLRTGYSDQIVKCPHNPDDRTYLFYMRPIWFNSAPIKGIFATMVYFAPTLWRLSRFIDEHKIEVISIEYPLPNVVYFKILQIWKQFRVCIGIHGDDILSISKMNVLERWCIKMSILHADMLLAHSQSMISEVKNKIPRLGTKYSVLPCGVDSNRLSDMIQEPSEESQLYTKPYALTIALLYQRKGIDILGMAIHKIRHKLGRYRFLIAGDGPEKRRLKAMARELEIEEVMIFLGMVSRQKIPLLLNHCDFFVLPSRSEPFGIALLEAMAFGKAILSTSVGGIPEIIEQGMNGILVPPDDADSLASGIERIISNKELRKSMGMAGQCRVKTKYDYSKLVLEYEQVYRGPATT